MIDEEFLPKEEENNFKLDSDYDVDICKFCFNYKISNPCDYLNCRYYGSHINMKDFIKEITKNKKL